MYEIGVWGKNKRNAHLNQVGISCYDLIAFDMMM